MTMSEPESSLIRKEMAQLRTELTQAVTSGIAALTISITALTESHHRALVAQEQRNSTFAEKSRLDSAITTLATNTRRLDDLERDSQQLEARMQANSDKLNGRALSILTTAAGYAVMALLMTASALLSYLLAHANAGTSGIPGH